MQAQQQIHSTLDLEALPGTLFSGVQRIIADAMVTFDHLDLKTGVATSVKVPTKLEGKTVAQVSQEAIETYILLKRSLFVFGTPRR